MKRYEIWAYLTLILFVCSLYSLPIVIAMENNNTKTYWKDIDTTQVVGELQDTCRCTIINDKMYRVKIKMVQQEVYQPYK